MNELAKTFRVPPAKHFLAEGLFARAFEPLRQALDAQQHVLADTPSPWLTRYGKGGPGYPEYRPVCLAQHCLDVGFIAAVIVMLRWCRGDLDDYGLEVDKQAPMEALLKRLLAVAMAHDADKYRGGRSRSPAAEDIATVHGDLHIDAWTGLSAQQLAALVNRVEQRGLPESFLAGALAPVDQLIAEAVHLADNALSKAARAEATGSADPDQVLLDALRQNLNNNVGLDIGIWRMQRFRHNPAVLARLRTALLNAIPVQSGFPPWILTLSGEELSISVPPAFDWSRLARSLLERFDEPIPSAMVMPNDGKTNLQDVANAEDLLQALKNGQRCHLLLRTRDKDIDSLQPWLRDWVAHHGRVALNEAPIGKLVQVLNFGDFQVDDWDWDCPVTRALGVALVLKAGVSSPAKELPPRFESLSQALQARGHDSLAHLGADWPARDAHARITQAALQVAADLDEAHAFAALLDELIETVLAGHHAPRADPGSAAIIAELLRQTGIAPETAAPEMDTPYQAHPQGGSCLTCGAPTNQRYKATDSAVPGIKGTAFSNRIGHVKDVFSESAGKTYLCPACVKALGLLGHTWQNAGQPLNLKEENLVNLAFPLQTRLLPSVQAGKNALALVDNRIAFGTERIERRLALAPWRINYSQTPALCVERVKDGLEASIDLHLRAAQTARWSGQPVQLFRARQHRVGGLYYSELMPPSVAALLQDLQQPGQQACTIDPGQFPDLEQRLAIVNSLIRRKDSYGRTIINDLAWAGWWALAWLWLLDPDDRSLAHSTLRDTQEAFPMRDDSQLGQLGNLGAELQKFPSGGERSKGVRAPGHLLGMSFDVALDLYTESLAGCRNSADVIAAMARLLYETLSRRQALRNYGRSEEISARCRAFAECAWTIFQAHTRHGDLSGKTRRYLRAAYITYFLAASERNATERRDATTEQD